MKKLVETKVILKEWKKFQLNESYDKNAQLRKETAEEIKHSLQSKFDRVSFKYAKDSDESRKKHIESILKKIKNQIKNIPKNIVVDDIVISNDNKLPALLRRLEDEGVCYEYFKFAIFHDNTGDREEESMFGLYALLRPGYSVGKTDWPVDLIGARMFIVDFALSEYYFLPKLN